MAVNIPGMSTAINPEQAYRFDAARSLAVAAADLRLVADAIERHAQRLADGDLNKQLMIPNAAEVRGALNEYRSATDALMRIDAALESAMLADVERAKNTEG